MLPLQGLASWRVLTPNLLCGAATARRGWYLIERQGGVLQRHSFATSAEKRKWKRDGMSHKEKIRMSLLNEANSSKEKITQKKDRDINPFLFLVVLPLAMTGLVVTLRDDLRQQLADAGRRFTASTKD